MEYSVGINAAIVITTVIFVIIKKFYSLVQTSHFKVSVVNI